MKTLANMTEQEVIDSVNLLVPSDLFANLDDETPRAFTWTVQTPLGDYKYKGNRDAAMVELRLATVRAVSEFYRQKLCQQNEAAPQIGERAANVVGAAVEFKRVYEELERVVGSKKRAVKYPNLLAAREKLFAAIDALKDASPRSAP